MAAWQIFKVSRKTFFNPSAWLSTDSLKEGNRIIWDSISGLFTTPAPARTETFEQAMVRLGLTEDNIHQTELNYYSFAVVFLVLGVAIFLFSFYLLFYHVSLAGFIIAIVASGLFFAQAFRFHFWYFQIKNRKLGCTFQEWRQGKVEDKGTTP